MQDWGLCLTLLLFVRPDATVGADSGGGRLAQLRLAPGSLDLRQTEERGMPGTGVAGREPDQAGPDVALEAVVLSETWLVFEQAMREVRSAPRQGSTTLETYARRDSRMHEVWTPAGEVRDAGASVTVDRRAHSEYWNRIGRNYCYRGNPF